MLTRASRADKDQPFPVKAPMPKQIAPLKSLEEREREYELARERIFTGSEDAYSETRTTRNILKLYDARADSCRLNQKVVETLVSVQNDNRAKTKVDGEEILALLDTGASTSCIGRGANAFLKTGRGR